LSGKTEPIAIEADWAQVRDTVGSGRLSVIMPVYNLSGAIGSNLSSIAALFERNSVPVELVPVDDGSTDGCWKEIGEFASSLPAGSCVSVSAVRLECNFGKGKALKAGFEASHGEYVLLLDGDLDVSPELVPLFFRSMARHGSDIVVGSKRHPDSRVQYPWHRRVASFGYFLLVRLLIGLKLSDTQTGMKLFRREVLGEALARMLVKTYAFDLELLAIAHSRGAKISESPVNIRFGCKFGCLSPHTVRTMAWDSLAIFYRLKILKYYASAEVPRPMERRPKASVVIACPNSSWMLDECIEALRRQTWSDFEVIILPDGEESLDEKLRGLDAKVIPTGKVRPAEKRNAGIAAATGEVVAFIDDDAYPQPGWLEEALKYFSEPSIGGLGGPAVTPGNDAYLAKIGGRVYENVFVSGTYRYRYRAGGVRRDIDDCPSCNLFVRKSVLDKIGGYRTDFWPGEDTLLCKDIVDAGYRIVYDPWVTVYHHRRAVFGAHLRQLGRYAFHRGYFVKRFPSNSARLSYFVPSAFVAYIALLAVTAAACASGFVHPTVLAVAALPAAVYALVTVVGSFSPNPVTWILTWAGIVATHVTYGIRFLSGLVAGRAPCEYIGKDHAK
jgi:glycosyltransferase involved in cell wall biosynthesis